MIEIKNIEKGFKNIKAVDGITFHVEKGEVFGLLGPNGAGKSTTISMLCTLLKPDKGSITVDGYDLLKNPNQVKQYLGLVPQDIALYPTLTAHENLMFWGKMYGMTGKHLKNRVDECLELIGLTDRAKGKISTFSGGMKRRVNIAAALLHKPKVLIMDEPTVGIDPQSRNHILETVLKLNKKGMTIIYTSHYMEEVDYLCNRIAIMDNGKVIALGTKQELIDIVGNQDLININVNDMDETILDTIDKMEMVDSVQYENEMLNIIAKNGAGLISKVIPMIEASNYTIHTINIEKPDLESVFLHLTGKALRD